MPKDRLLELLQLLPGLDSDLLVEQRAGAPVSGESVRLPATAVQREHEMAPEPLAKWLLPHERLELLDKLVGAAEASSASILASSACSRTSSRRAASRRSAPPSARPAKGSPHSSSAARSRSAARPTAPRASAS